MDTFGPAARDFLRRRHPAAWRPQSKAGLAGVAFGGLSHPSGEPLAILAKATHYTSDRPIRSCGQQAFRQCGPSALAGWSVSTGERWVSGSRWQSPGTKR
jgi:hypothetical protein